MQVFPPNISISTNKDQLDVPMIHTFLKQAYWAKDREYDLVQKSIEHSMCFGIYYKQQQIGFARVVSDCSIFAYLMDVFIIEDYRGQGLGLLLIHFILQHPPLKAVQKWMLATKDAHALYKKVGFSKVQDSNKWMTYSPSEH